MLDRFLDGFERHTAKLAYGNRIANTGTDITNGFSPLRQELNRAWVTVSPIHPSTL
jgi:hypothetical protein